MQRKLLYLILLFITQHIYAQQQTAASDSFVITGKVKAEKKITLSDLHLYKSVELNDINTSCSPKREEKVKSVKVVLLKNILDSIDFQYDKPRELNTFYFLFVASDGYKILFSFNEIYNTEIGNNLFVVTEMDGKPATELENRILILSTKDIKGGSRNMKGLSKIIVGSID